MPAMSSSSSYDPRRSRHRPATAAPTESAPVEALLGPEPTNGSHPPRANGSMPAPAPTAPAPRAGAPSRLVQLAPLLVVTSVLAALVWWLTRRRS